MFSEVNMSTVSLFEDYVRMGNYRLGYAYPLKAVGVVWEPVPCVVVVLPSLDVRLTVQGLASPTK